MIRQFYLENDIGVRWNLNNPESGLLINPSGLGYSMKTSYTEIGHSFIQNFLKEKQQDIQGTIVFGTEKPYTAYGAFISFINMTQTLRLVYKINSGEYYRDVDLVDLEKSELKATKILECDVVFRCKGLFYSDHIDRFVITREKGELRLDYRWPARFSDYANRSVIINNNGHVPAAFEVSLHGYCENPVISIVYGGKEIHRVRFPTILQQNEQILYSSVDGKLYCLRVDASGNEENFADSLDINNSNFFKLPVGDSEIRFSSDTGATNRTVLTVYKFYRTV